MYSWHEHYENTLQNFFSKLCQKHVAMKKMWFHNGATPHGTNAVLKILKEKFGQCVISCQVTLPWPPRSPDITPCDFFYGGMWWVRCLKVWWNRLYSHSETKIMDTRVLSCTDTGKLWNSETQIAHHTHTAKTQVAEFNCDPGTSQCASLC